MASPSSKSQARKENPYQMPQTGVIESIENLSNEIKEQVDSFSKLLPERTADDAINLSADVFVPKVFQDTSQKLRSEIEILSEMVETRKIKMDERVEERDKLSQILKEAEAESSKE